MDTRNQPGCGGRIAGDTMSSAHEVDMLATQAHGKDYPPRTHFMPPGMRGLGLLPLEAQALKD